MSRKQIKYQIINIDVRNTSGISKRRKKIILQSVNKQGKPTAHLRKRYLQLISKY
jgi:hypothetical protein